MDSNLLSLAELFPQLCTAAQQQSWQAIKVSGIKEDSRQIEAGDIFVARCGEHFKGTDYITAALARGAVAVLVDKTTLTSQLLDTEDYQIPLLAIDNMSVQLGVIAAKVFGNVVEKLNVIGITGTNGKTSCAHYLAQALNSLKENTFIIGTLGNGHPENLQQASRTTPDACSLQQLFAEFYAAGASTVVMEVSSHALEQGRVQGVPFYLVAYTNLSQDHLDYHGTMQAYAQAKAKLFTDFGAQHCILNVDDQYNLALHQRLGSNASLTLCSYSESLNSGADFIAQNIRLAQGLNFDLLVAEERYEIVTDLLGKFNVANVLLCIATLSRLGYSEPEVHYSVANLTPVPGRMQKIQLEDAFAQPICIVDYAHTPDALEKALQASRVHATGKLWLVFGCGGDRDNGKRALMASVAEQWADRVIVTSDNPRTEDPAAIIQMITGGFSKGYEYSVASDRKQAIEFAIKSAEKNDVVLIAGKGHEDYQEIMGVKQHFSDGEVVLEALTQNVVSAREMGI